MNQHMNIVIVGHVDHGKSTIIGRLLADTGSLPDGKLEQVKEKCRRNSKPFEYAFLLDALKDEQEQGITIDVARCFFKTSKRGYTIIDAPGHIEFLKNMVTGASRAEAALLVIDASEGIKENSMRHAYLLSMLGIKQIAVLVNKMDIIEYNESIYTNIVKEYSEFLDSIHIKAKTFIPVSGRKGDNIKYNFTNLKWYKGITVLEQLDNFDAEPINTDKPFRMPVQGIYKFTAKGDTRRIVAGTVLTGILNVGDRVVFYPSKKSSTVKSIESFNTPKMDSVKAGYATGFTLEDEIYIKRGEIAVKESENTLKISQTIKTNIFWLGKENLIYGKSYILKLGTSKVKIHVKKILKVLNSSTLEYSEKSFIEKYEVAEVIFETDKPIAFDIIDYISETGRFVIVDGYEISGGGIIKESLDKLSDTEDNYIPYGRQWIDEEDVQAVVEVLRSDYITTGPKVEEFERTVAQYVGAKYAVAVSSGTAALHAACFAAGIKNGDEVITTPITFAASSNCILYCGGRPVFADIDSKTYNIDPIDIENKITEKTKAILPVHFTGQPCDMDRINSIAKKYNLTVIEDASHALGADYKGKMIGSISDMTVFSFHPIKHITTGEGGMITTNDENLYNKLKLFRNHGINRDGLNNKGDWYYEQLELGYNYRISDIQCALGISQMKKIQKFVKRREEIADIYNRAFEQNKNIVVPYQLEGCNNSWHLYVVQILNKNRKQIFDQLRNLGIGVNVNYIPVYKHPYYQKNGYDKIKCVNAENLYKNIISLPIFPKMIDSNVDYVFNCANKLLN